MTESLVNRSNSSRKDDGVYSSTIARIAEGGYCPFCPEHVHDEHKKPIYAESDYWLATDNMYPYNGTEHHLLFIHRAHIERIEDLTANAWVELLDLVKGAVKVRHIVGSTLVMRHGATSHTGATVAHLHAQLVASKADPEQPVIIRVG